MWLWEMKSNFTALQSGVNCSVKQKLPLHIGWGFLSIWDVISHHEIENCDFISIKEILCTFLFKWCSKLIVEMRKVIFNGHIWWWRVWKVAMTSLLRVNYFSLDVMSFWWLFRLSFLHWDLIVGLLHTFDVCNTVIYTTIFKKIVIPETDITALADKGVVMAPNSPQPS